MRYDPGVAGDYSYFAPAGNFLSLFELFEAYFVLGRRRTATVSIVLRGSSGSPCGAPHLAYGSRCGATPRAGRLSYALVYCCLWRLDADAGAFRICFSVYDNALVSFVPPEINFAVRLFHVCCLHFLVFVFQFLRRCRFVFFRFRFCSILFSSIMAAMHEFTPRTKDGEDLCVNSSCSYFLSRLPIDAPCHFLLRTHNLLIVPAFTKVPPYALLSRYCLNDAAPSSLRPRSSCLRSIWYIYADTSILQLKPKKALDTERR